MRRKLHILASCTDRKRLVVTARHRLGSVRSTKFAHRAREWISRLADASESVPALELYGGPYWTAICEAAAGHPRAQLWVASAGYGLIPVHAPLTGYSATFSPGAADSVPRRELGETDSQNRRWWRALTQGRPSPETTSVEELAMREPDSDILVAASPAYVEAMRDDLLAARARLSSPDRLVVVSGRSPALEAMLADNWLRSDARFQTIVGGSLSSLHGRVARMIVPETTRTGLSARRLRRKFSKLLEAADRPPTHDRLISTDDEVRAFIQGALKRDPRHPRTPLLRALRDSGRACEQGRFKQLYEQQRAET